MDGAHCDSVVDHYTLPSNSIQMDVKVPVQPSNFDPLQKGALMGASTFMEQDKNHSNQCNYKTKSIPSPGTTILFLCFPMNLYLVVIQLVGVKSLSGTF